MNKLATMEASARAELFAETAARMGVADAIVEKDFWVCWALKQLFSNKAFEGRLLFKGGTSLSKIYHAINRFSEDIELTVDYVTLGFTDEKAARQENISKTKRNAILNEMMKTCRGYIAGEFLETLRKQCVEVHFGSSSDSPNDAITYRSWSRVALHACGDAEPRTGKTPSLNRKVC